MEAILDIIFKVVVIIACGIVIIHLYSKEK